MRPTLICDFCSGTPVTWSYPCRNFILSAISGSNGAWAACDTCHDLIEANDRAGLAIRCTDMQYLPIPEEDHLQASIEVHKMFFANRLGAPIRVSVHTAHCCLKHGCKYDDDYCPVANGFVKQEYPCEECRMDRIEENL